VDARDKRGHGGGESVTGMLNPDYVIFKPGDVGAPGAG